MNVEGQVIHDGKIVGYFEYWGSSDYVPSKFYDTWAEVWNHWRDRAEATCTCGQSPVKVILWNEYGTGNHFPCEACLTCHAITGETRNHPDRDLLETSDEHPLGPEFETDNVRNCRGDRSRNVTGPELASSTVQVTPLDVEVSEGKLP